MTNLWDSESWRGFARESSLATSLISSGANAIGRANYADRSGDYYVAFFAFSQGIERLGKLTVAAERVALSRPLPSNKDLRAVGHNLRALVDEVREIECRTLDGSSYRFPNDKITQAIIDALDSFADASRGRYANFTTLSGKPSEHEMIAKWWREVVEPILAEHFHGTAREKRAIEQSHAVSHLVGTRAHVLHVDELGNAITSAFDASMRGQMNRTAQKYGRYYVLRLVRWMAGVFRTISQRGDQLRRANGLFGHHEHFSTFLVEDRFLRDRKSWPLH